VGEFGDSLGKQTVRDLWNTPLLRYLHKSYNIRFRYMGLPGVDLLDVKLWKDMIDEVIAFEIRADPNRHDRQGRRSIIQLRRNLQLLGVRSQTYFGPMEEVVILREDYEGTEYKQDNFITLYNLDFCDEIGSKIDTRYAGRQVWRFEAIRQILADQRECYRRFGGSGLFLILLTIRDQMKTDQLSSFLADNPYHDTQRYVEICGDLKPLPQAPYVKGTHTWAMKAFLHDIIRKYLINPNFSAIFFPIVKYTGKTPSSPMLHCMILCRFDNIQKPSPLYLPQNYLTTTASIRALDTHALVWEPEPGEPPATSILPNSEQWFKVLESVFLEEVVQLKVTKTGL